MAAYAYYKGGKLPEAIASAERYTAIHPGTKDAALAHFIIASAHFDEIRGPNRDQSETRKALAQLKVLRSRFGDSPYAKDADNRIRIAEDTLAANEMEVGRYYQQRNNYVAAINRFKTVVTDYQTTAHVEEALYRLVDAICRSVSPTRRRTRQPCSDITSRTRRGTRTLTPFLGPAA